MRTSPGVVFAAPSRAASPDGRPESGGDYVISLEKLDGRWLVAAEDFAFLPGQEP
jgi:hypothetical protein